MELSMSDLRAIESRAASTSRQVSFGDPGGGRDSFRIALHVAGPYVRVEIDGHDALSMRRVTGEPVEGFLGFALDFGRATFSDVRVAHHRALGREAACRCDHFDAAVRLDRPNTFSWTSVVGRRVEGLQPSSHVRLLLWSTGLTAGDPTGKETIHAAIDTCRKPFVEYGYPLDVHVTVRGEAGGNGAFELPSFPLTGGLKIEDGRVHANHGFPGLDAEVEGMPQSYELGWPGWGGIFIDPAGIARSRGPIDDVWRGVRLARYVEGR